MRLTHQTACVTSPARQATLCEMNVFSHQRTAFRIATDGAGHVWAASEPHLGRTPLPSGGGPTLGQTDRCKPATENHQTQISRPVPHAARRRHRHRPAPTLPLAAWNRNEHDAQKESPVWFWENKWGMRSVKHEKQGFLFQCIVTCRKGRTF